LKGSRSITCQSNGSWSAASPTCVHLGKNCPDPGRPRNGDVKGLFGFGEKIYYTCDECYELKGPADRQCQADEKWTGTQPTCESVKCSFLQNPANGYVTSNSQQCNNTVQYHCDCGYRLNGSPRRRCQRNGMWTGNEPVCKLKICQDPGTPRRGSKKGNLQVGQTLYYSCDQCYQLRGSPNRTCQCDLSWSGRQPICTAVRCSGLRHPTNGRITEYSRYCGRKQTQFLCYSGYQLRGSRTITCQSDGSWSAVSPTCVEKSCPEPESQKNGIVKGLYSPFRIGEKIYYSCDQCYKLIGPANRQCQADERWTATQPTCEPVTCSLLQYPVNGYLTFNSQQCNSIVQYNCWYGYQLNGSPKRRCQGNGTWTGNEPVCELNSCQDPGTPWRGNKKGILQVGKTLHFSCDQCYQLKGSPNRTCQSDHSWSGRQPTCTAVRCSELHHPTNGRIIAYSRYCGRKQTEFLCYSGYQLRGSRRITCQSDGSWSAASPTCV
ncbi:sushi, von Willebrand factor type A, EGF and pentraxin domain-containing 1-like, partial [Paramuricea clavata]